MWLTPVVLDEGTTGEKLYMAGGQRDTDPKYPLTVGVFDPVSKSWR